MATKTTLTMTDAAARVLGDTDEPLHTKEITKRAVDQGLVRTRGKTPEATMAARLAVASKQKGSRFVRTSPATYGLRTVTSSTTPARSKK